MKQYWLRLRSLNPSMREHNDLDAILPEAFAVVREASVRTLGLRHYDAQMIGGITLHQGKIAEMKTGEVRPWFQLYQPI